MARTGPTRAGARKLTCSSVVDPFCGIVPPRKMAVPATRSAKVVAPLPKGDVLTTAKVAGVLAAKQTPNLIPLAHPLAITSVDITFDLDQGAGTIEVRAIVRCDGKTGVEMEAMTACAVAALTIYDMCKSAEKGISIEALQLVRKSGGKSGTWERG